ncbi:MAG TPA: ABC transporter permease [Candidatus Tyrphobacter sp.]
MNRILAYLEEAVASLWRNRMRSLLTMLGMIIGSASIITVFGISRAATSGISSTFASFGQEPLLILPDQAQDYPQIAQIQYRDIQKVSTALGDLAVSVMGQWQQTIRITFGNKQDYISAFQVGAYQPDALVMSQGRKIDAQDVASAARVCVLTSDVDRTFFGSAPAVGSIVRINGTPCEVVGVYADIKGSLFNSLAGSGSVGMPYTTYHDVIAPGPVDFLAIYPADPGQANRVGNLAVAALQHVHGARAKYTQQNAAGTISSFENVLNIIGIGLSAIGGVALIVAGIGIMNIMLVSVTERTREIGIRKAVGASRGDIALQFLMESILLALLGGGVGMGIGVLVTVGGATLLSRQLGEMIIPYVLIVSLALMFSIIVGVVFGTYPALRAARLDPIEALRA